MPTPISLRALKRIEGQMSNELKRRQYYGDLGACAAVEKSGDPRTGMAGADENGLIPSTAIVPADLRH